MEERHRDDGFEATFVVSLPRDQAWARLRDAAPALDGLPEPREGQWWIPGVEGAADELEVDEGTRLRARKATMPCKGTEIVVTLEDADTGTRITFVQSGFGDGFAEARPWLEAGWWAIRADLFLYFERGVSAGRHLRPWGSVGGEVRETPAGLVVDGVEHDGFLDRAGVRAGDLLLTLGGAPVVNVRELASVVRSHRTGDSMKVRVVRPDGTVAGALATV
jgi:hypothetical protein